MLEEGVFAFPSRHPPVDIYMCVCVCVNERTNERTNVCMRRSCEVNKQKESVVGEGETHGFKLVQFRVGFVCGFI